MALTSYQWSFFRVFVLIIDHVIKVGRGTMPYEWGETGSAKIRYLVLTDLVVVEEEEKEKQDTQGLNWATPA